MAELIEFLQAVFVLFPEVVKAGALIAALVNLGKWLGLIKDGYAPVWAQGLNAAFWVAFYAAGQAGIEVELGNVIEAAGPFVAALVAFLAVPAVAAFWHNLWKKARAFILGFSFSQGAQKLSLKA